jgi:alkylresorcinol/alkylpyrone synthase
MRAEARDAPCIVGVAGALPAHRYRQDVLTAALRATWENQGESAWALERLDAFHASVGVQHRHLALPLETYHQLIGFGARNRAYIAAACDLGQEALTGLFGRTEIDPSEIDLLMFTTVTGVAAPSLDARLANRLPFRSDLKRVPLFGLGCLAGTAGVARVADYLTGHPTEAAVLLSVELCSLTIQARDVSAANMIASGLFGDGAAAVLMVGPQHHLASRTVARVVDTRSVFFPNTLDVMGWNVEDEGLNIVLSAEVPEIARHRVRPAVETFLANAGLSLGDVSCFVCHPGGPKVLQALQAALSMSEDALSFAWKSLRDTGNLSSTSVLMILQSIIAERRPARETWGLMLSMGPGFCAEMALLRFC